MMFSTSSFRFAVVHWRSLVFYDKVQLYLYGLDQDKELPHNHGVWKCGHPLSRGMRHEGGAAVDQA